MSEPIENKRTSHKPLLNSLAKRRIVAACVTAFALGVVVLVLCAANASMVKADSTGPQRQPAAPGTLLISGVVSGVWDLAGSPYIIITDTLVAASSTLTIEPGVEVRFDGHYKFIVNGTLVARGTATDTILFTRNQPTDESRGWGLRFDNAPGDASVLSFCTIEYGYADDGVWGAVEDDKGGGIYCNECNLSVENCHIRNNVANVGGGIYADLGHGGNLVIRNNLIEDNQTIDFGFNGSGGGGLAIFHDSSASARIENNIIVGNSYSGNDEGYQGGGGISLDGGSASVLNNTIVGNSSPKGSGIHTFEGYAGLIANNVVWGNTGSVNDDQITIETGYWPGPIPEDLAIHHNDIQDAAIVIVHRNTPQGMAYTAGMGNIDADPLFVDPAAGDLHLAAGSPCIDAGMSVGMPADDMDGEPRPGRYNDIGADEFPYAVKLTPRYQRETSDPGAVVNYAHTLYNSGALTETFELASASSLPQGLQPLNAALGSGESLSVTLTVTVPAGAAIGDVHTAVLTASSSTSPTVAWARAEDVTLVGVGVELEPDRELVADPGQVITFTHVLTNVGSVQDTYSLTMNNSQGWATLLTPNVVTLESGANETVQVRVTLPATAAAGPLETAVLTATSWTAAQAYDVARDTTTVNGLAGPRYVTTAGDDALNNCLAQAQPCRSVGWAVEQAHGGDTIQIAAGVYTATDGDSAAPVARIAKDLTLMGGYTTTNWSASNPISYPTLLDAQGQGLALYLDGDGITVTLNGLTMQRGAESNVYVYRSQLVMSNCVVISNTQSSGDGLYLYYSSHSRLIGNRIAGNDGDGVYALGSFDMILQDNVIAHNNSQGVYMAGCISAIFQDNTIVNNGRRGMYVSGGASATLKDNTVANNGLQGLYFFRSLNQTLSGNTIAANGLDGVYIDSLGVHRLDNNIIVENEGDGLVLSGEDATAVLRHNTLASNAGGAGVRLEDNSTVWMTNTIVASHTLGVMTTHPSATVMADHTLWHANSSNTDLFGAGTLAWFTHDIFGDPKFAGGTDPFATYHVQAGSAAIDAGADTGLATDIDGQARAPDVGADEYPYAVQLTPGQQWGTARIGAGISYMYTLRNSGALTETFDLTAASGLVWSIQPPSATLGSGAALNVTLNLTAPLEAAVGDVYTTVVTATPQADHNIYASVVNTTTIVCTEVQSVTISGPQTAISGTAISLAAAYTPPNATGVTLLWDNGSPGASASYTWTSEGIKTVVVTATAACGDPVTDEHIVTVAAHAPPIYLPLVLKNP